MEALYLKSTQKSQRIQTDFVRYLYQEIRWNNRLIAIKGARGVGKTTLLLQYLKKDLNPESSLYVSMDDLFFADQSLYELAKQHVLQGGRHLLLDEVHKYPNWSREIKLIYDDFEKLQVVFTSSSILEIHKGESDLSRRAISYTLKELSLREYVYMCGGPLLSSYTLEDILTDHITIAADVTSKIAPIQYLQAYNKHGAYPYFQEDPITYSERLQQNVQLILEVDIPSVIGIDYNMVVVLKKLLKAIATSVPFTPNISKLASLMNVSRQSLLKAIDYLDKSRLITSLSKDQKGIGVLTKPDKILLNNTNLLYLLGDPNIGTIRETFFANQLSDLHTITLPKQGDFLIDGQYTFEVGGKGKKKKQLINIADAYVVRDDIDMGSGDIIPLWVFGMSY